MNKSLLHTPEGVRDVYGEEYARKLFVEKKLHDTIHLYGYQDIQTPTFEFFDVYSKEIGTTPSSQLYKFFDKEGNTLALRPDFTPSCARCAAKYFMDETAPLRFTYSGSTFTNTLNLQGKLKEVTQMGAELMLEPSVEADAEMISLVVEALKNCGLTDLQITVGEVEYFKGICAQAGLNEEVELLYGNKGESQGNRVFADFLPHLIRVIENAGMLIIDEFGNSLHNKLAEKIIEFFMENVALR